MTKKDLEQITKLLENSTYAEHVDYSLDFCDNQEGNDIELIFYLDDCEDYEVDEIIYIGSYAVDCIDRGRYIISKKVGD